MDKKDDKRLLEGLEGTVPGMRKGITKRELVKSLSKEDWKRIDEQKRAEELQATNKKAYELFLLNDQLVLENAQIITNIREGITAIRELQRMKKKNKIDILKGSSDQLDIDGRPRDMEDLEISQLKIDTDMRKALVVLRSFCSKLYVFVNQRKLGSGVVLD